MNLTEKKEKYYNVKDATFKGQCKIQYVIFTMRESFQSVCEYALQNTYIMLIELPAHGTRKQVTLWEPITYMTAPFLKDIKALPPVHRAIGISSQRAGFLKRKISQVKFSCVL